MNKDRAQLKRLQRLARVREIAKREAVAQAAEAESTLAQLNRLSDHVGRLAGQYTAAPGGSDGHSLRQQHLFITELSGLGARTTEDAARARDAADARQADLAGAERRYSVVSDHSARIQRALSGTGSDPALCARRGFGTDRE